MATPLKLTQVERLILLNQHKILRALADGTPGEDDHTTEVLEHGFEYSYNELANHLYEPFPADAGELVFNVLAMYDAIENYCRKHPDDVASLKASGRTSFAGFDGNNEGAHLNFTKFVVKKKGMFAALAPYEKTTDGFNSHWPMVETYREQHRRWKTMGEPFDLTAEQFRAILDLK